jgi:hypothetical protein
VRDKNGPEANWLTSEFDTKAAYKAGGGVPHGRYESCLEEVNRQNLKFTHFKNS